MECFRWWEETVNRKDSSKSHPEGVKDENASTRARAFEGKGTWKGYERRMDKKVGRN